MIFSIEYKQGKENVIVNALLSVENMDWKVLYTHDAATTIAQNFVDVYIQKIIQEFKADPNSHKFYLCNKGEMQRKGKLVVGKDYNLR